MFQSLMLKVGAVVTAAVMTVAGWFGYLPEEQVYVPTEDQRLVEMQKEADKIQQQIFEIQKQINEGISLGSYTPVGGKYYTLQSGITSSATSIVLISFNKPISDH